MQDLELYRRILGIERPWRVERVELSLELREVHVFLGHAAQEKWACLECGTLCRLYDHQPERRWRHMDMCHYRTILHAEPPRAECQQHGVRVIELPWAKSSSRFTTLFEAVAIECLKTTSQKAVSALLRLSWDEIHGIMERAVQRGLARRRAEPARQVGMSKAPAQSSVSSL